MRFTDRREAGQVLAVRLAELPAMHDPIVVGLPRGGLPVAEEVAHALHAPLDLINVRKLGVPGHEELAMGAIAAGGVRIVDEQALAMLGVDRVQVEQAAQDEGFELARRERLYHEGRGAPPLRGRTVILVDDGLATGATMHAAVMAVRAESPAQVIVAVPVAPADAVARLWRLADEVVVLSVPDPFFSVGAWYDDFTQVTDGEVRGILARSAVPARSGVQ